MSGRGRGVSNAPAWMTQREGGDRMGGGDNNGNEPPPPPPFSGGDGYPHNGPYNRGGPPPNRSPPPHYNNFQDRPPRYHDNDRRDRGGGHWDDRRRRDSGGGFRGGGGGGRRGSDHHFQRGPPRGGPPPVNHNMPGAIRFRSYEEEREWVEDRRRKRLARATKFDILPTACLPTADGTAPPSAADPLATANAAAAALAASLPAGPQQTRHARRLYVGNLPTVGVTEDLLHQEFKRAIELAWVGPEQLTEDPILSVYINYERKFSFLEFKTTEMATACMNLDGLMLQGQALKIKRPNDYNELMAAQNMRPIPELDVSRLGIISSNVMDGPNKIFIGGLHYHLTESQVLELLQAFGKIKAFHLVKGDNETGNLSKGYCFVEYADPNVTATAIQGLHGMDIGGGKSLTARLAGERGGPGEVPMVAPQPPVAASASAAPLPPGAPPPDRNIVGGYDIEALVDAAMGNGVMPTAPVYMDALGLPLTRIVNVFPPTLPPSILPPTPTATAPTAAALPPLPMGSVPLPPGNQQAVPAAVNDDRILVLHNMVKPEDLATDSDYQILQDEVRDECAKYGTLLQLSIPRTAEPPKVQATAVGKIFLQYETAAQAQAAQSELQGRQFDDAVVQVSFYPEADFASGHLS